MSGFGRELQKKEFCLQDGGVFLNQGAYGTIPKCVEAEKYRILKEVESQPDVWFRRTRFDVYKENIQSAAAFVGAEPENLVFTRNTTTGINQVVKNLPIAAGDGILMYSWTHIAVKNTMDVVAAKTGARLHLMDLRLPIHDKQSVVTQYETTLNNNKDIRYVILDYISSVPAVLLPLCELVSLCKSRGLTVIVDGAHTPGQLQLSLETLGADFFVGNLHKWAFAPRGCAIVWVHPRYHDVIRPLVTSQAKPTFQEDHQFQGTDDYSSFFCCKRSLQFYTDMGGLDAIGRHNRKLVAEGAQLLVDQWGTRAMAIPTDMEAPFMRMVRLPNLKAYPPVVEVKGSPKTLVGHILELTLGLWDRFHVQALCLYVESEPWVRVSAHIYNCLEDYQRLAEAILVLVSEE